MDRVGFEGQAIQAGVAGHNRFSILWWIELVLRVVLPCPSGAVIEFQYPLVDRVGFEGVKYQNVGIVAS